MTHYKNCTAQYPEKVSHEAPQHIQVMKEEGFEIHTCVDCGATDVIGDIPDDEEEV